MKQSYKLMKSLSAITAIVLLALFPQFAKAQVSSYAFTQLTNVYTPITGGTVIGSGAVDDNSYTAMPIGFTFNYNNAAYTTFSLNANGYIALGNTIALTYSTVIGSGSTNNVISALNYDLQGNASGELRYQTIGTAPNRILVVQWSNFSSYYYASYPGDNFNFQIRLYEGTDVVEIMYGAFTKDATGRTPQVGLRGNTSADYNVRTTTTSWPASTAAASNLSTMTLNSTVLPTSGLTYRWTPPPPTPMAYVSSTTTQTVTTSVTPGSVNNQIIGIQVVTSGTLSPFAVTSLTLNSTGSTNFASDVTNVKVYYTGNSATFATTTLFGSATTLASPITGSQTLSVGTNYFWVTYDIAATATIGDFVDAECTSITMNGAGGTQTPSITAPAGNRMINYCTPVYSIACSSGDYINNFSTTGGITNITNNNSGCNAQPNNYIYYSSMTVTQMQTLSFNVSMQSGSWGQGFHIWVDWNHDGDFYDTGESVYASPNAATTPFTTTITIPATALTGTTRMRVRCAWASVPTDPCTSGSYGETEDYNINVIALPAIDAGVLSISQPAVNPCHTTAETVTVIVKNYGTQPLNFATNPLTVNASVAGPNPVTFTPVTINTGTLAVNATMPVTITSAYNMQTVGNYTFTSSTSLVGDGYAGNDAMSPTTLVTNTPTVMASSNVTICRNDSTPLSANGTAYGYGNTPMVMSNTNPVNIVDFNTTGTNITVPSSTMSANNILYVKIDSLTHTYDGQLTLTIIAPNGSQTILSALNGGAGQNYIGTVFTAAATSAINTGSAPFTGNFQPQQPFSNLTGSAQGMWQLRVNDNGFSYTGMLWKWTLALPTPNGIASYTWSPSTGLSSSTISNPMAAPTVTTNYVVTVTDANGCPNSDTVSVNVNQLPVVALGPDSGMCVGDSVLLDAGPGNVLYTWSNTPFSTQTTYANAPGTYSVMVFDGNGCGNSDTITLVNYIPQVSLGADTAICQGNTVMLNAGPGFNTYNWSTSANTQQISVSTGNTYIVNVTDVHGCPAADTVVVTVNSLPVVNLGSNVTTCQGSVTLNAGPGFNSYLWSNTDTTQQTTVTTTGNYIVTVTNANGCNNSDTVLVTINPTPIVNLGLNITQCGGNVTLNAGNAGATYQWSNGPVTQLNMVSASGTYSVLVTNSFGCSNSDTVQVTIYPRPIPSAGNDTVICAGSTINLVGTPNGYATYTWTTSNFTANGQVVAVSPGVTTSYALNVVDMNGCSSINPDSVTVTVLQGPTANFTTSVSGGFNVTFTNQSYGSLNPTYSWDFGDGSPVDNSPNSFHTYTANGTYMVTLTVTSACGTDVISQAVVITGVGIDEASAGSVISIYPNPNDGVFNVAVKNAGSELTLDILDIQGKSVYSEKNDYVPGEYMKQLDLSGIAKGMYYVRINTGKEMLIRKIIIQ